MSELDLGLKVGVRRLLWSMGQSTRLDVELRGDRRPRQPAAAARRAGTEAGERNTRGPYETYTDLDVLGVMAMPGFQISTTIADCKSGSRDKPTARMFWARGVADLFGADQVMLVREREVNDGTRQLSSRLGITVLTAPDLVATQDMHTTSGQGSPHLDVLFDREAVAAHLSTFTGLDRRLNALMEYREFDYWVYDHHRNPMQLVAHLQDAAGTLDPRDPAHLAVFVDLAWLYTLALLRACAYVQGAFVRDLDRGLQEYLFGGARDLQEKEQSAALLRSVAPRGVKELSHLPEYYSQLREITTRLMRRPQELQTALRYAEVTSALMAARRRVTLQEVFGAEYRPVAAKLVADVCGFLVSAAGAEPGFRTQARAWLLSERVEPPSSHTSHRKTAPGRSNAHASGGDGHASRRDASASVRRTRDGAPSDERAGERAAETWDQQALPLTDEPGERPSAPDPEPSQPPEAP